MTNSDCNRALLWKRLNDDSTSILARAQIPREHHYSRLFPEMYVTVTAYESELFLASQSRRAKSVRIPGAKINRRKAGRAKNSTAQSRASGYCTLRVVREREVTSWPTSNSVCNFEDFTAIPADYPHSKPGKMHHREDAFRVIGCYVSRPRPPLEKSHTSYPSLRIAALVSLFSRTYRGRN